MSLRYNLRFKVWKSRQCLSLWLLGLLHVLKQNVCDSNCPFKMLFYLRWMYVIKHNCCDLKIHHIQWSCPLRNTLDLVTLWTRRCWSPSRPTGPRAATSLRLPPKCTSQPESSVKLLTSLGSMDGRTCKNSDTNNTLISWCLTSVGQLIVDCSIHW